MTKKQAKEYLSYLLFQDKAHILRGAYEKSVRLYFTFQTNFDFATFHKTLNLIEKEIKQQIRKTKNAEQNHLHT